MALISSAERIIIHKDNICREAEFADLALRIPRVSLTALWVRTRFNAANGQLQSLSEL